jgi:hypothetical protein
MRQLHYFTTQYHLTCPTFHLGELSMLPQGTRLGRIMADHRGRRALIVTINEFLLRPFIARFSSIRA